MPWSALKRAPPLSFQRFYCPRDVCYGKLFWVRGVSFVCFLPRHWRFFWRADKFCVGRFFWWEAGFERVRYCTCRKAGEGCIDRWKGSSLSVGGRNLSDFLWAHQIPVALIKIFQVREIPDPLCSGPHFSGYFSPAAGRLICTICF